MKEVIIRKDDEQSGESVSIEPHHAVKPYFRFPVE